MTFRDKLEQHGLELRRAAATVLQINVGFKCNLACRHCHLEAGPARSELMDGDTIEAVISCAGRGSFETIDITGGAPELLPGLPKLVAGLAPLSPRLMVRTNLVALSFPEFTGLIELYKRFRVAMVASLPSTNHTQAESQRGAGVWEKSISMLKLLNANGFGIEGAGLTLDIVSNPTGAFLPAGQAQSERKFRLELTSKYGISFTNLFTFANVPLGRFRAWLENSGNLHSYMRKLEDGFNPCTVDRLMCRSTISVDWQGYLYDCDFNLAAGLHHSGQRRHISEYGPALESTPIAVGDHCYACTAGPGFT
jgi:radical SAM/Cys-rich protein